MFLLELVAELYGKLQYCWYDLAIPPCSMPVAASFFQNVSNQCDLTSAIIPWKSMHLAEVCLAIEHSVGLKGPAHISGLQPLPCRLLITALCGISLQKFCFENQYAVFRVKGKLWFTSRTFKNKKQHLLDSILKDSQEKLEHNTVKSIRGSARDLTVKV